MEMTSSQMSTTHKGPAIKRQRNLSEVVEYFDTHWSVPVDETLQRVKMLDKAFGYPSQQLPAILIAGSNGKSITAHFTAKLLAYEGFTVGTFTSPHLLMYKERFSIDSKSMPSRFFTDLGNEAIAAAESLGFEPNTAELLTIMALLYFKRNNVDVAVVEISNVNSSIDPTVIFNAKVATITRVTSTQAIAAEADLLQFARLMATLVTPGMHVISGDQSKSTLSLLQKVTQERGGQWIMPMRKLAHLPYPLEQLFGRCAALAERVAAYYLKYHHDNVTKQHNEATSILIKTNG
jgi:folylpolyglutamate synthase/dihydropteroate synthase